jgi:hypothetical protein
MKPQRDPGTEDYYIYLPRKIFAFSNTMIFLQISDILRTMHHTYILVLADTQEQLDEYRNRNKGLIPGLEWTTSRRLESRDLTYYLRTIASLECGEATCGVQLDAIINLSTADMERFREALMPCLLWSRV